MRIDMRQRTGVVVGARRDGAISLSRRKWDRGQDVLGPVEHR